MKIPFGNWYSALCLMLVLTLGTVTGCGSGSSSDTPPPDNGTDLDNGDNGQEDDQQDDDVVQEPLGCDNATYAEAMNLRTYQVMTEAFINGDPGIGHGEGYGTSHHRGDIQGIIDSLEYIADMGFNAIWMTPLFETVPIAGQDIWADRLDATGYYASNYFAIDPRFGSMEKAREMVEKAHELGLYVFFDGVFGHFKENAHEYPSLEDRTVSTDGSLRSGVGRNAVHPDDLAFFKEVATYWIKELKIDGWRLDQAYEVPLEGWREIRAAVEEASSEVTYTNSEDEQVNPLGYMVAEIWKGAGEIADEAYGPQDSPALCSAFDFPMRYAIVRALAVEESGDSMPSSGQLNNGFSSRNSYPDHAVPNGFIGNHDLVRFGDLLQRGGIAEPEDDEYWLRHKAAYSFLSAYSGPITLYYGEEVGQELPGYAEQVTVDCAEQGLCDDHVARTDGMIEGLPSGEDHEVFTANERQADLRDHVRDLMHLRADHPSLYRGERTAVPAPVEHASELYVDHKAYEDEAVVFLLNVSDADIETRFDACALGSLGELVDLQSDAVIAQEDEQYQIQVPALTGIFLRIEQPDAEGPSCGDGDSDPVGEGPLADCTTPDAEGLGPLGASMFIRGTYAGGNAFDATPQNRQFRYKGDDLYQVVVTENQATDYDFKFASSDWSHEFAVAGSAAVTLGAEQPMAVASGFATESSISIPEAGDYVFSFEINADLDGGTMMVSQCAD